MPAHAEAALRAPRRRLSVGAGLALLSLFLGLAPEPLLLALIEQFDERLHRHRSEKRVHVHRHLDIPVYFGHERIVAVFVHVHLGPLGLTPLDQVARVPLAVGVAVLDDAEADFARGNVIERIGSGRHAELLLFERSVGIEQLHDIAHRIVPGGYLQRHTGEFLGIVNRIGSHDRVVLLARDVHEGPLGNGQLVFPAEGPGRPHLIAAQAEGVAHQVHIHLFGGSPLALDGQQHSGRVELHERVVQLEGKVLFGIDLARGGHLVNEGVGFLGLLPLLARCKGSFPLFLLLLALLLLLLGFDIAPRKLELIGSGLQPVDRIVLVVGDRSPDGVGKLLRGHVEPQSQRIAARGEGLDDDPVGGDAVEEQAVDAGPGSAEIEQGFMLQGTFALLQDLTPERLVGEHAQVELWLGGDVLPDRVVPQGEVG